MPAKGLVYRRVITQLYEDSQIKARGWADSCEGVVIRPQFSNNLSEQCGASAPRFVCELCRE